MTYTYDPSHTLAEVLAGLRAGGWTITDSGKLRTLVAQDGVGWVCLTSADVWAVLRSVGVVPGGVTADQRQAEYEARWAYLEEHGVPGASMSGRPPEHRYSDGSYSDPVAFAEACCGRKLAPLPDYSDLPDGVLSPEGEAERFRGLAGLAAREHHATGPGASGPETEAPRHVTVTLTREQYDLVTQVLGDVVWPMRYGPSRDWGDKDTLEQLRRARDVFLAADTSPKLPTPISGGAP